MSEHKFKAYLLSRQSQWNDNQNKRFVYDALTDKGLPDTMLWEDIEAHLKDKGSPPENIEEAGYIWTLYMDHKKRNSN